MPLRSAASPTKDMGFFYDEDAGVSFMFPWEHPSPCIPLGIMSTIFCPSNVGLIWGRGQAGRNILEDCCLVLLPGRAAGPTPGKHLASRIRVYPFRSNPRLGAASISRQGWGQVPRLSDGAGAGTPPPAAVGSIRAH